MLIEGNSSFRRFGDGVGWRGQGCRKAKWLRPLKVSALVCGIALALAQIAGRQAAAAQPVDGGNIKTLTLGLVSETERSAVEEHFRDFVRYVARRLSSGPEIEGKVVVAPTAFQLVKLLEQRRVDFYMESAYPTYTINHVHGAGKTLLRRWKSGMTEYQGLIFTSRDSGIRRLEDLRGKTIVFEDPGSTSAYLLPKVFLQRSGFNLVQKRDFDPFASPSQITYLFAYSQKKLIEMVLKKQVSAGAFSNDDHAGLTQQEKSEITVLAETERLPRHLLSVRSDLPPAIAARLEEILLAMHEDDVGRRILNKTDQTTKFDELPGGEAGLRRRLLETFYSPDKK
jgi:phosphonate transport system substrate-binding protein